MTPLSVAVREGSRHEHEAAESSSFVAALLGGRVTREEYAAYLGRLRPVYAALESVARSHRHRPDVAAVADPALDRLAALDADLAWWGGGSRPSPAASAYAARVEASVVTAGLYAAHHYTRYLGDLSGGRALGRALARAFDLPADGTGTRFYAFPGVPRPKPYKDAYRVRLDALRLTDAEHAAVVAEVRVAFGLNRALLDEVAQPSPSSSSPPP